MSNFSAFIQELFFAPRYKAAVAARAEATASIQSANAQSEIVERAAERNAVETKFLQDVLTAR